MSLLFLLCILFEDVKVQCNVIFIYKYYFYTVRKAKVIQSSFENYKKQKKCQFNDYIDIVKLIFTLKLLSDNFCCNGKIGLRNGRKLNTEYEEPQLLFSLDRYFVRKEALVVAELIYSIILENIKLKIFSSLTIQVMSRTHTS